MRRFIKQLSRIHQNARHHNVSRSAPLRNAITFPSRSIVFWRPTTASSTSNLYRASHTTQAIIREPTLFSPITSLPPINIQLQRSLTSTASEPILRQYSTNRQALHKTDWKSALSGLVGASISFIFY